MKVALVFVILLAVGLCISTWVLFNRIETSNSQFDAVNSQLDALNNQFDALNNQFADFKGEEARTRKADIASADRKLNAQKQSLSALENSLQEHKRRVEAAQHLNEEQQKTLSDLRDDVAKGVQSAIVPEVLTVASELAVQKVIEDKALVSDPSFLNAVARVLADSYREKLRGEPGIDANDAKIADMLKKDAEFLSIVTVTKIIEGEEEAAVDSE